MRYVALLRAVNVGGTGKLPMAGLKAMCIAAGFTNVRTYIASGNVVFESVASSVSVQKDLAGRLETFAGRPVGILVRTASELALVVRANPFPKAPPRQVVAIFLDAPPPEDAMAKATGRKDEEMRLGKREIYVHYPSGIGLSKLKLPAAAAGTARNMNTIAKLAEMAGAD